MSFPATTTALLRRALSLQKSLSTTRLYNTTAKVKSLPATFYRSGTSNGLLIHRHHLPPSKEKWQPILSEIMGSPDPWGRQLNGLGSGSSSTSKICVVGKTDEEKGVVPYEFIQVGVKNGKLEWEGNCGNMSASILPFALDEKIITPSSSKNENGEMEAKIFNLNTSKTISVTCHTTPDGKFQPLGEYSIDGVPGTGSKISMAFLDPAGSKTGKMLPTGNPTDTLTLPSGEKIRASLIDIANPGVFILASDLSIPGTITPSQLEENLPLMSKLESIRRAGATAMNLNPTIQSIPKIVLLSPPPPSPGSNITCRALSMQQPHRAVPLTLALNLGANVRIPGTLGNEIVAGLEKGGREANVVIAHASGKVEVGSVLDEKTGEVESALLHRTARVLMRGEVYYTEREKEGE